MPATSLQRTKKHRDERISVKCGGTRELGMSEENVRGEIIIVRREDDEEEDITTSFFLCLKQGVKGEGEEEGGSSALFNLVDSSQVRSKLEWGALCN